MVIHICEKCGIIIGVEGEYNNDNKCANCEADNINPIKAEIKDEDRERLKAAVICGG